MYLYKYIHFYCIMKINLIIATYAGKLYKYRDNETKDFYLRYNLELLNNINTNIDQITIMTPKVDKDHIVITDYYNLNGLKIDNIRNKIKFIECDNIGISYGQFFVGMYYNLDFDYHILIEDDYIIFQDNFETIFMNEYNKNNDICSLLCSFIYKQRSWNILNYLDGESQENINLLKNRLAQYPNDLQSILSCKIPDFALCILNKYTVNKIFETFGNIQNIIYFFDIKFNSIWLHQILFGYVLKIAKINIYDICDSYMNIFFNSGNNTISLCNSEDINEFLNIQKSVRRLKSPLFIPLDILYPYNYNNVLLIMMKNLINETEFIQQYNKLQNIKKNLKYYKTS